MARKKLQQDGFHLKFIPSGRLNDLELLANNFPSIKNKTIALMKYIEVFSSIVERLQNSDKEFIPVSTTILKNKIGLNDVDTSKIISDLLEHNFLLRDKSTFVFGKKAWSYKPIYKEIDTIKIPKQHFNKTTNNILADEQSVKPELSTYYNTIKKLTVDNSIYNDLEYYNVNNNYNNVNGNIDTNTIHTYYNSLVPCQNGTTKSEITEYNSFVPYEVIGKIPTNLISLTKLMAGKFRVSQPIANGRIYSNITNLHRDYRKYLRLNGKQLIGFDIANSQPLLAAIAFLRYSEKEYGFIKDDVLDYKSSCESGKFYEYFMELNGVDTNCEKARTKFKKLFFGKVFYTKEVEKENILKTQFKEKYPTCYEAIFKIKGGLYSKGYVDFPMLMTEIESEIILSANMELIAMGYDVVNIFDSLYSDSDEAIELAKQMVIENFAQFGIIPTLKDISYRKTPSTTMENEQEGAEDAQEIPEKLSFKEYQQREYELGNAWKWVALGDHEYRLYLKDYDAKYNCKKTV